MNIFNVNSLRLFSYSFKKNLLNDTIIFNKYLLNNNILKTSNFNYTINVKTPANSHKVFRPSTIAVTNANKHLIVNLFDQSNADLGKMSMEKAKELSLKCDLKLVIIDESTKPPKFKLMNGNELYQLQLKHRDEKRADKEAGNKFLKEKEIDINLGISDHDLDVKVKMINNFFEKGNPIKIKIKSVMAGKNAKNIPKLQDEFLEKLKKLVSSAKLKVESKNENQILIRIKSSKAEDNNVKK